MLPAFNKNVKVVPVEVEIWGVGDSEVHDVITTKYFQTLRLIFEEHFWKICCLKSHEVEIQSVGYENFIK